ncbi:MAG TPA: hypothetical protein VF941_12105 [Clostridia bacterium]
MKVVSFKVRKKGTWKISMPNIERYVFLLVITAFSVLVIVQASLANPTVRNFLLSEKDFEGTPIGSEEYFYKEGSLTLRLIGEYSDPGIKVLVNGDEVAGFSQPELMVKVKNGDVVELDGSGAVNKASVQVFSKSSNIDSRCVGKSTQVRSGIVKLTDIKIESDK